MLVMACRYGTKESTTTPSQEVSPVKMVDYVFTCDLVNDPNMLPEYKQLPSEKGVWPEVTGAARASGAQKIHLYLQHIRLVMMITLPDSLSLDDFQQPI